MGDTMSAMNWRSPSSIDLSTDIWGVSSADRRIGGLGVAVIWARSSTRAIHAGSSPCYVLAISGNLINHDLVGYAAQRRLLLNGRNRRLVQDGGYRGRVDHRPRDVDRVRGRQALDPCRDVDGLAEIILPLVEHDREARTFMDADLDHEVLGSAFGIERLHGGAHPQTGGQCMFRLHECRHHGIANRLYDGALLGRDDFQQGMEMRADQIERDEIADPLV